MSGGLSGRSVLITRAQSVSKAMASEIEAQGGRVVYAPVMSFEALSLPPEYNECLHHLDVFDWLVFTSGNGVRFFMDILKELKIELPNDLKIAVVGTKTAAILKKYGHTTDLIPDQFTARCLAEEMRGKSVGRVLLPLGKLARPDIEDALRSSGFQTERINVYDTVCNQEIKSMLKDIVEQRSIDVVTFASPSAVRFFCELTSDYDTSKFWGKVIVACIGETTAKEAEAQGMKPHIIPNVHTTSGLIVSIMDFYNRDFEARRK